LPGRRRIQAATANPLSPTSVLAGSYAMTATAPSGYQFVQCGGADTVNTPTSASATVFVPADGAGVGIFYVVPTTASSCQSLIGSNFNGTITFSPTATTATLSFNGSEWVETVPSSFGDNVFLTGVPFQVPAGGLPGGINPVSWQIHETPIAGISVSWQWAAAVYTQFSTDLNAIGVKPLHSSNLDQYPSGDQAGTPENERQYVIGGARGGGGSNFTGSYSSTSATCS
jgi:hypothetical protein